MTATAYMDEKAEALDKVAKLIDTIINPPDATNVVAFPTAAGAEAAASAS
ncbi:MAG: hypothetical protein WCD75_07590 [Rhodoplanes sp.]